jgi:hypothetical protein
MEITNKAAIEAAGFTVNDKNQVFENGKRVPAAMIPIIEAGRMLAAGSFDINELRKSKQKKSAQGTTDLVAELDKIDPAIGMLRVGGVAKIPMPAKGPDGKDPKRSFVMSIVTKLNNVTLKDKPWSGRVLEAVSDDAGEFVYVARLPDTDAPKVRKTPTARKPKDDLSAALERSRAHLDPNAAATQVLDGEPVVIAEGEAQQPTPQQEEAIVIQH